MSRDPDITVAGVVAVVESGASAAPDTHDRRRRLGTSRLAVAAAAVLALVLGVIVWQGRTPVNPAIAATTPITAEQLEQEYGVRLGIIGLVAGGGLVELKFQVTDADKATALFGESEDMPLLAVQGTSTVLQSASGMKHSLKLLDGASYFFLYTNVSNVLHAGTEVSFVFDEVRIPDLKVQQ